jgi:hypothetical protein
MGKQTNELEYDDLVDEIQLMTYPNN